MTAMNSASGQLLRNATAPQSALIERGPLYFRSSAGPLFGWLHRSTFRAQQHRAVLLCPPWGFEQIHAHRGLRHLADGLARAGFVVLRFDYHGTGDSAGSDEAAGRLSMWLENIESARRWLEREFGFDHASVVGLRLGAALAARAASEMPIDDLVLWAPVVKGRAYIRELKALSMTAEPSITSGPGIEAAGFFMSEQMAEEVSGIDLLKSPPQCRRALIVTRDDLPTDTKLLDYLCSLGIDAQQTVQPGYAAMMAEPHFTAVPQQAISEIVRWLTLGSVKPAERSPSTALTTLPWPTEALFSAESTLPQFAIRNPQSAISPSSLRERAIRLSNQPDLFGIHTEPCIPASATARPPTIILLNAGSAYRVGASRLHVLLARRLACDGFSFLRLDFSGLGDSVTPDLARENDPYPATAFRDIDLAMKFLRRELNVERVILMGLCSGAYAAFQSAVQFLDPILVESVIINPLTFHWQEGMTVESAENLKFKAFREGVESALRPGKWLKLLTGRSKLGVAGAVRVLRERWQLTRNFPYKETQQAVGDVPLPSHSGKNDLPGDLTRIAKNGRRLSCYFSRSDPGYDILTFYATPEVDQLCRTGQMRIAFIDDADHTFSRRAARENLLHAIASDLSSRYVAGAALDAKVAPVA
jgi:pimeloyl-ACP methyl ester carboxylesterase